MVQTVGEVIFASNEIIRSLNFTVAIAYELIIRGIYLQFLAQNKLTKNKYFPILVTLRWILNSVSCLPFGEASDNQVLWSSLDRHKGDRKTPLVVNYEANLLVDLNYKGERYSVLLWWSLRSLRLICVVAIYFHQATCDWSKFNFNLNITLKIEF